MIHINYKSPLKQKHVENRMQKCNLFSRHSCCRQRAVTNIAVTRQLVTRAELLFREPPPPFSDRDPEFPEVPTHALGNTNACHVGPFCHEGSRALWGPLQHRSRSAPQPRSWHITTQGKPKSGSQRDRRKFRPPSQGRGPLPGVCTGPATALRGPVSQRDAPRTDGMPHKSATLGQRLDPGDPGARPAAPRLARPQARRDLSFSWALRARRRLGSGPPRRRQGTGCGCRLRVMELVFPGRRHMTHSAKINIITLILWEVFSQL